MSEVFAQRLDDEMKPLKVANRDAFVFPFYRRRMHEHADNSAVVTSGGKPIERSGETLLLGMVPMERRYAIGPVENGRAEVLPQHLFVGEHEKAYIAEYKLRDQSPDKVHLRYIPNVVDFVAWKIDPSNPNKITTLGYLPGAPHKTEAKAPALEELESLRVQKDVQAVQIDEMKRKLDELTHMLLEKKEEPQAVQANSETTPCGKEVKIGFVEQHRKYCKKPECASQE